MIQFGVTCCSGDGSKGVPDLPRAFKASFSHGRVMRPLHVVDQVAGDIVDAAVREDPHIQLRAHRLVIPILLVGALLGAADADEDCGYWRKEPMEGSLAAILYSFAVLVCPACREHPLDPALHQ